MTLRDLQTVYSQELIIVELESSSFGCNQLFDGYSANIPEKLLNRKIIGIDTDFLSEVEYSWLIVNIEKEKTLEEKFDFSNMHNIKGLGGY